jgi:hypothetical protein
MLPLTEERLTVFSQRLADLTHASEKTQEHMAQMERDEQDHKQLMTQVKKMVQDHDMNTSRLIHRNH